MPDFRLAYRPFPEQIAFFERKVSVPTNGWRDLVDGDHAHGFMVAGATRQALLEDLRAAIARAIREGRTLDQFRVDFDDIVQRNGWTGWTGEGTAAGRAWRTRVIFETNIQQSYNAGRYAQLTHPDMLQVRPFWQYRHNDRGISRFPRPQHQAWNGLVLRYDDPWWRTHFPANGWGCKCGVRALGQSDLDRKGLKVGPAPGGGTDGIDEGFAFNIGESARSLQAAASFGKRIMDMPESWQQQSLADAAQRVDDWMRQPPTARASAPVGYLQAEVVKALTERVQSALVAMSSVAVRSVAPALSGELARIAERLSAPRAVLADGDDLIYAWLVDGQWLAATVQLDGVVDGVVANWVQTLAPTELADLRQLKLLTGSLQ